MDGFEARSFKIFAGHEVSAHFDFLKYLWINYFVQGARRTLKEQLHLYACLQLPF